MAYAYEKRRLLFIVLIVIVNTAADTVIADIDTKKLLRFGSKSFKMDPCLCAVISGHVFEYCLNAQCAVKSKRSEMFTLFCLPLREHSPGGKVHEYKNSRTPVRQNYLTTALSTGRLRPFCEFLAEQCFGITLDVSTYMMT